MAPNGKDNLLSLSSQLCTNVNLLCRMALVVVQSHMERTRTLWCCFHHLPQFVSVCQAGKYKSKGRVLPSGCLESPQIIPWFKVLPTSLQIVCACMCTCVHVLQVSQICVCVCVSVRAHTCTGLCMHMCVCTPCISMCTWVCVHTHPLTHTCPQH